MLRGCGRRPFRGGGPDLLAMIFYAKHTYSNQSNED